MQVITQPPSHRSPLALPVVFTLNATGVAFPLRRVSVSFVIEVKGPIVDLIR